MRGLTVFVLVFLVVFSVTEAARLKKSIVSQAADGSSRVTQLKAATAPEPAHARQHFSRSVGGRDVGDNCTVDADCSYLACQDAVCDLGTCAYAPRDCPIIPDTCQVSGTCDVNFDSCVYIMLDCDDYNNCTTNVCQWNSTILMNECHNEPIPNCVLDTAHSVNFTIDIFDSLNVTSFYDGSVIEFCQTTNYYGPTSTVVLGFDEYIPCSLNQRGSCDNKLGFNSSVVSMCVIDPQDTPEPCPGLDLGYSMNLQGVSSLLEWTPSSATFVFQPLPSGHLVGTLEDPAIPELLLDVDIWFQGAVPGYDNYPAGSPVLLMSTNCSGTLDTSQWYFYSTMTGTITGAVGSAYEGMILSVTRYGPSPQYGFGANNHNDNLGLYATFTWSVVAQPTNISYVVTEPLSYSLLFFEISGLCPNNNSYCEMMGEPNYAEPNNWIVGLNNETDLVTYCNNFTLDELINCRPFYDIDSLYPGLFEVTNSNNCSVTDACTIDYNGTLYATTILPSDCQNWPSSCGETVIRSSCYNISVTLEASGKAEIRFISSAFEFMVEWLANLWLCGPDAGNLQILIRTRITQNGNPNISLCNPSVDLLTETGYPLVFVDPLAPPCVIDGGYCYQEWTLRTFDGEGIIDFSGFKKLLWDVCDNLLIVGHVEANMDLQARHSGDQSHVDGKATAELALYVDSDFDVDDLYTNETLLDSSHLFADICLTNHQHLDILTRRVTICYSTIRDLDPFNPLDPDNTGCNTPGPDVVQMTIYTCDHALNNLIDNSIYDFFFVSVPDATSSCNYFSFKVLATTAFSQVLRVTWCTEENGGQGSLTEFYEEFPMQNGENRVIRGFERSGHSEFSVECPPSWFFDWNVHRCHGAHAGGVECDDTCNHDFRRHHPDDDDDDSFEGGAIIGLLLILGAIALCIGIFYLSKPKYHKKHHHHHHNKKSKKTKKTKKVKKIVNDKPKNTGRDIWVDLDD